ncbi:MAG: hypothetical protein A3H32_00950 [Betaproteobacteria bacterium RIFCSPLOWO2_02_FULL_63_19]|nr:MAG: hypothetical protein A3H32_00950 [Betaproteobacteria bacterium RIFCSPLOWO2_02_FULL_63_19]
MNKQLWVGLGSVLILIAIGAYFWLRQAPQQPPPPAPVVSAAPIVAPPAPAPAEPAIRHPIDEAPSATPLPPIERADAFVKEQITGLLGAKRVKTHVRIENFVRSVVATVDNLARSLAPPRMWPIHPTPGRFNVETAGNERIISSKNAARYRPFVALAESVDTARAVALYKLLYPLFQRAYETLGYPGKHFNDRLVEVIDLLLETPIPSTPLKVELPEVQGPIKPSRPWLLYRFSDPALERLASGQKILLRVGRENEKRLKAKLVQIRKLIATEQVGRRTPGSG